MLDAFVVKPATFSNYHFFFFGWRFEIHFLTKMVVNKSTLRALAVLVLIDTDEEK